MVNAEIGGEDTIVPAKPVATVTGVTASSLAIVVDRKPVGEILVDWDGSSVGIFYNMHISTINHGLVHGSA